MEDHPDVRAYLSGCLAPRYRIAEAENGREGLRVARVLRPELVISDVVMPEMDGYALCQALKADPALGHIPVILLTAGASSERKHAGLALGADDYLSKPFPTAELLARVENLVAGRRRLRARFSQAFIVQPGALVVSSSEAAFLERVRAVAAQHLGDGNFSVDWLANEVGLSPRQLQRRLRATARLSAAAFIRTMRLQRAAQLLTARAGTVSEIAYRVGFNDPAHFARLFRRAYGVLPSRYGADAPCWEIRHDAAPTADAQPCP